MEDKDINIPINSTADGEYTPKHEKPSDPPPANRIPSPPPGQEAERPVYDSFMYEPIGFEESDQLLLSSQGEEQPDKKDQKRTASETFITVLFILLILGVGGLAAWGIINDITKSPQFLKDLQKPSHVVLYKESKPEGANDLKNFQDENGKYTTEGAAAAVRPSIVEIYTYTNSSKSVLYGTGSGIVISEDGYIVTNAHVLQENGCHDIKTLDGHTFGAKIIGRDAKTDIAVIKVTGVKLTPAVLGNSDEAIVGEQVIAIGNPAQLSSTVTDGIISAVGRKIKSDNTGFEMDCIQTNADISPGNSGGALVNMYGQVIGITSSKYVSSSVEGLGFAITINEALPVIEELIDNGFIAGRFRIGITLVDMSTDQNRKDIEEMIGYELPKDFKGIYISSIAEDCDIYNTDLKPGDFITAINGKSVRTYDDLYNTISSMYTAGDKVPATCAHVTKDGDVSYYNITFRLMDDKSGNF